MYWTMPLGASGEAPMGIVNSGAYPLLSYREARRGLDTSECLARPVRSVWGGFPGTMAPVSSGACSRQAHSTPSAAVCRRGTPRRTSRQPSHTRSWGTCRGRRRPQGQPGVERGNALQVPPMALRTLLDIGAREPLHEGSWSSPRGGEAAGTGGARDGRPGGSGHGSDCRAAHSGAGAGSHAGAHAARSAG